MKLALLLAERPVPHPFSSMRVEPGPPGGDTLREEKGTEEKTKLFLLRGRRGKSVVALRGMKKGGG